MKMKLTAVLLCLLFVGLGTTAQHAEHIYCGAEAPKEPKNMEKAIQKKERREYFHAMKTLPGNATMQDIPIQIHIIRKNNGSEGVSEEEVFNYLGITNNYFNNAFINLVMCGPINYIDDTDYFDFDRGSNSTDNEKTVQTDHNVPDVCNIYFPGLVRASDGDTICGFASFPWDEEGDDLVVVGNSCLIPGNSLTHEMGHYFGLYHTHQVNNTGEELVDGSNCETAGDLICDTPADPNISGKVQSDCNYNGNDDPDNYETDSNGWVYSPDTTNFMSYSRKSCRTTLTTGQYCRMYENLFERDYLVCNSNPIANLRVLTNSLIVVQIGNDLYITVKAVNVGTEDVIGGDIGIYLSSNLTVTASSDDLIAFQSLSNIPAGTIKEFNFTIDLCDLGGVSNNNYYVGAILDRSEVVAESNESDNTVVWPNVININCLPNLEFEETSPAFSFSTENIVTGAATVSNNGGQTSAVSTLRVYASTDATINTSDNLLGTYTLNSLTPGEHQSFSFNLDFCSLGIPNDTYFIGGIIDPANSIIEWDETDNTKSNGDTYPIDCISPTPNLTTLAGTENISIGSSGTYANFSMTVVNNGDGNSVPCKIGYYASTNSTITTGDILLGTDDLPSMVPNQVFAHSFYVDFCGLSGFADGTYHLGYIIDYLSECTESNEADNTISSSPETAEVDCFKPNLTTRTGTESFSLSGNIATMSLVVENTGNLSSTTSYVGYYASTDNIIDNSDFLLGTDLVGSLAPGGTSTENFVLDLCSVTGLSDGYLYLGYIIDYTDSQDESDEDDNSERQISPGLLDCYSPDLTTQAGSAVIIIDPDGHNVSFNLNIENVGNQASSACTLGYYASTDANITTDDYLLGTDFVGPINIGGFGGEAFSVDLCNVASLPAGTYYLGYIIDYENDNEESDETNNTGNSGSNTASLVNCPVPGINLTTIGTPSFSYTPSSSSFSASVEVINNGMVAMGEFTRLAFYLSTDANITTSDYQVGATQFIADLAPGETTTRSVSTLLCNWSGLPGNGLYYFGYIIDHEQNIIESIEYDNDYAWTSPLVNLDCPGNDYFDISVTSIPYYAGTISGEGNYVSGSTASLTAHPAPGFKFVRWEDSGIPLSTDNPYSFAVNANVIYYAIFEEECPIPTNVQATIPTNSSLNLTWDPVPDAIKYQVRYREHNPNVSNPWTVVGTLSNSKTITGLNQYRLYEYRVRAECSSSGWGNYSNLERIFISTCAGPENISFSQYANGDSKIEWTPQPTAIKHQIRYKSQGGGSWLVSGTTPGNNFKRMNFLTPGVTYQFRVRTYCEDEVWSQYSEIVTYTPPVMRVAGQRNSSMNTNGRYSLSPNPASDVLYLDIEQAEQEEIQINIINLLGSVVHSQSVDISKGKSRKAINLSSFTSGYYIMDIRIGAHSRVTRKFVIER